MDENLRTFLQHNSNFKYTLFLNFLKEKIYEPICSLDAFIYKSKEPIPFSKVKSLVFEKIQLNENWGGFFDCAWFKFTADIENVKNNLVAVIDVGGEGCIYNQNGSAVQGITNVLGMVDRFQSVKGKAVIPLNRIDNFKDGRILFYADCGNNGRGGKSTGQARFKRADICVFRQDILDLYYDILACYQLLCAVNDNAQKKEITARINKAISIAHNTEPEKVIEARNILSEMFDGKYKQNFTVYAVGHGHLDLAWLWPVRETKRKAIRTFSNAIYESEQCPSYVFNGSQPQQYEFIKEKSPELYEKIKSAVGNGNIEPQGGMWVEPDTNLPCGESLIRQCFYGRKYFRDEFQKDVKTLWLPDVFGYTAALPQIIKKCGMDSFMTIKLSWNNINRFPHHTFIWQGLDDSRVLVHMPPEGDYNSNATPYAFEKIYNNYKEKKISDIALMPFGIGDGGGGPGEYHVNMAKRCEGLRYIPNVKMSSSEKFFDELKKNIPKYPEYKGELYLEKHQGTYTTQGKVKKNNRQCEVLLHFAEWICTMAFIKGKAYPHKELDEIWKEVLLYQFHDILPGSSIQRVYEECNARYEILKKNIISIIDEAVLYLQNNEKSLFAINPIDFDRSGYVKHKNEWYTYSLAPYSAGELKKANLPLSLYFSKNIIENEHLKVVFNSKGQIEKIFDKRNNYNCVASKFNAVRVYKDRFVHPYNAWDIDINYTKHKPTDMKLVESKEYCDGNSVVRENKFVYKSSSLIQRIILMESCSYIKVENEVDWHETHKMLRIDAYPKNFSDKVLCDIQFGNIERSTKTDNKIDYAQFEIPAHKWVDVFDGEYGVAILNDCKYGHRVKDGLISLNCLRSPVYPDKTADRGKHTFTYAIYPHKEKPMESELIKIGYELNNPIKICDIGLDIKPIFDCDNSNIIIETIFVNDRGNIAVRMYETAEKSTVAKVNANFDYKSIKQTNMLFENEQEIDLNHLVFEPFEIKTLEVILK